MRWSMNGDDVKENRETNCDENDDTFEVFLSSSSSSFRLMAAVGMMVLVLLLLPSPLLPFFVISYVA